MSGAAKGRPSGVLCELADLLPVQRLQICGAHRFNTGDERRSLQTIKCGVILSLVFKGTVYVDGESPSFSASWILITDCGVSDTNPLV